MISIIIDALVLIVVIMSVLSTVKRGLLVGIYNIFAVVFILLFTLHFYPRVTDIVKVKMPVLPVGFGDFVAFGLLFTGLMIVIRLFRELLLFFLAGSQVSLFEKLFGIILGSITGILSASLFTFWIYLSPWKGMEGSLEKTRLAKHIYSLPAYVYTLSSDYIIRPYLNRGFVPNKLVYIKDLKKKK